MARLPATFDDCDPGELGPGRAMRCRLLVYNPATEVDAVHVTAVGPLAEWTTVDPVELTLMPAEEGEVAVTVLVPEGARLPAGPSALAVEVRSGLAGSEPTIEEHAVEVARTTGARLAVRPSPAGDGAYQVVVESEANHPLRVALDATAPGEGVVAVRPGVVDVAPFGTATAELRIGGDGARLRDPVTVSVVATADRLELRTEVTHTPPAPPRRRSCGGRPVLAGAAVAAVALAAVVESRALLIFLLVVLGLWLLFGYAGCRIMAGKDRSAPAGWALGILLGPIGLVVAALLPAGAASGRS